MSKQKVISVVQGDITIQDTQAIVNSANPTLNPGGGISGMIHKEAGTEFSINLKLYLKTHGKAHLETGEAIITGAGLLPNKYVIHTVGPKYNLHKENREGLLKQCYISCLDICIQHNITTISFPSISTGIYGCPIEKASIITIETVVNYIKNHNLFEEVRFVLFNEYDFEIYRKVALNYM